MHVKPIEAAFGKRCPFCLKLIKLKLTTDYIRDSWMNYGLKQERILRFNGKCACGTRLSQVYVKRVN